MRAHETTTGTPFYNMTVLGLMLLETKFKQDDQRECVELAAESFCLPDKPRTNFVQSPAQPSCKHLTYVIRTTSEPTFRRQPPFAWTRQRSTVTQAPILQVGIFFFFFSGKHKGKQQFKT